MGDQLSDGRKIRVLNVVDDSTRKCLASLVAASLSSAKEVKDPDQLIPERAAPKGDCVGQRTGMSEQAAQPLSARTRGQAQLHPAGEASGERSGREFQQVVAQ